MEKEGCDASYISTVETHSDTLQIRSLTLVWSKNSAEFQLDVSPE